MARQKFNHAGRWRRTQGPPDHRPFQILFDRVSLHEQPGLPRIGDALRVADERVGAMPFVRNRLRDGLSLGIGGLVKLRVRVFAEAEGLLEHEVDPRLVDGRVGALAGLVVLPLIERQPQVTCVCLGLGRIVLVEPLVGTRAPIPAV